jgi:glycopeptide antibiotics resistance protein
VARAASFSVGGRSIERTPEFAIDPGLARFAAVLLAYVIALAALATLSPFDFTWSEPHGYSFETTRSDVALNLAFLFPVGFLLRLARGGRGARYCLDALGLGLGLSIVLESLQAFLPSRVTSPTDVLTNGLGAWAGALVHSQVGTWLDRRLQKQLSLHLPLANILYLVVPLLALDALASGPAYDCILELPLALFMAHLAGALYVHRLIGAASPFANWYALAIGGLFGVGYLPMCARSPQLCAALALMCALFTRIAIAVHARAPTRERRFVLATIRSASPWFGLYLIGLAISPWLSLWLPPLELAGDAALEGGQANAVRVLRDVAAFTLLGYLISELHARSPHGAWVVLARVLVVSGSTAGFFCTMDLALGVELRAFGELGILFVGAALAGALIHRSQLRLVRSWGRTTVAPIGFASEQSAVGR